jgi:Predicted membrane protein (DUF2306)
MSGSVPGSHPITAIRHKQTVLQRLKAAVLAIVLLIAASYVWRYIMVYYFNWTPSGLRLQWEVRLTFFIHITAGMVALLVGPFQFSARLRRRSLLLHRVLGRTYLIAVLLGGLASIRMIIHSASGWAWQFATSGLALAWLTTSAMAYYAIRRRLIDQHKEWMVRSYVVTFAFVTFRILFEISPLLHVEHKVWSASAIWASWSVPLLITEVILQLNRMARGNSSANRTG